MISQILSPYILPVFLSGCFFGSLQEPIPESEHFSELRERMVREQLESRDIDHPAVLRAMGEVPRHRFVPEPWKNQAYSDYPLPIGFEQTISQPYIVALMTQLANPQKAHRVLEIGTGSGYQAAVLSRIVKEVYSIEIVTGLANRAEQVLSDLGYSNVSIRTGDGYLGWPEKGPFDLILITAAAPRIPDPLVEQLVENGRMVMPLGKPGWVQQLVVLEKKKGKLERTDSIMVRFVPMTGEVQKPG